MYRVFVTLYQTCGAGTLGSLPASVSINAQSASCGLSRSNKALLMASLDTLNNIYCPGISNTCHVPSASYPGFVRAVYSDTIALPPCSDWKMNYTDCCRHLSIANISQSSSSSTYVEAGLNNATAVNSSGWLPNTPPLLAGTSAGYTPLYGTDAEGDSLYYSLIAPMYSATGSYGYSAGYSAAQPLGSGSAVSVNNATRSLMIQGGSSGRFTLAMRIDDYRNGTKVGYCSRDWNVIVLPGSVPKAPFPALSTSLKVITCPGQSHSMTLSFQDSVATDSIFVGFQPPASPAITYTTSSAPAAGTGSGTISWTTPATLNPATTPYIFIPVFVRNNACPARGYAYYTIAVRVAQCLADSVWAGDANGDKTVNVYDPLAIAVAYGNTGPTRTGAATAWAPQACLPWSGSFVNGINMKHADCDGNGTVNSSDLAAVTANYGLVHLKEVDSVRAKTAGLPDLYLDHMGIAIYPGASLSIPIKLGSVASPASNFYGLAGTIRIAGITPGAPAVSYPVSWVGTAASTVRFTKAAGTSNLDWAYARNNHTAANGNGTIANLNFTIPAGTPAGQKIIISFGNVKLINAAGNELTGYNVLSDTLSVRPLGVAGTGMPLFSAAVVPNPSQGAPLLTMQMQQRGDVDVTVMDMAGRAVWKHHVTIGQGVQNITLPAALNAGIYTVHISDGNGMAVLKWTVE